MLDLEVISAPPLPQADCPICLSDYREELGLAPAGPRVRLLLLLLQRRRFDRRALIGSAVRRLGSERGKRPRGSSPRPSSGPTSLLTTTRKGRGSEENRWELLRGCQMKLDGREECKGPN